MNAFNWVSRKAKASSSSRLTMTTGMEALFLETQLQASLFSFAGVVGKGSYLIRFESDASMYYLFPGREYRYMELFGGNRMLVRRAVHEEIRWRALAHFGEDTAFIRDCLVNSVPMYSADGYHFVIRRFAPRDHTWKIGKTELLATHQGVRLPEVQPVCTTSTRSPSRE